MKKISIKISKQKQKELEDALNLIEEFLAPVKEVWHFQFDKKNALLHSPILKRIITNIVEPLNE